MNSFWLFFCLYMCILKIITILYFYNNSCLPAVLNLLPTSSDTSSLSTVPLLHFFSHMSLAMWGLPSHCPCSDLSLPLSLRPLHPFFTLFICFSVQGFETHSLCLFSSELLYLDTFTINIALDCSTRVSFFPPVRPSEGFPHLNV